MGSVQLAVHVHLQMTQNAIGMFTGSKFASRFFIQTTYMALKLFSCSWENRWPMLFFSSEKQNNWCLNKICFKCIIKYFFFFFFLNTGVFRKTEFSARSTITKVEGVRPICFWATVWFPCLFHVLWEGDTIKPRRCSAMMMHITWLNKHLRNHVLALS